ncbi:MAG: glycosyltransferase family 39 protein [Phycisphaerales bacterium]|nr:MAG: glycosyltransferase family 39 protein [Phycisphaerales bacterium]
MPENTESRDRGILSSPIIYLTVLILIVLLGVYLRFEGLGVRSLWRDELCTWHVSRMGLWESLRWGPELTKPPLYQFALRLLTPDPHPSEFLLRFPAAICGVLTVLAGWWLGRLAGGRWVGLALAGLLTFNGLQIDYSQECRPYSMLVLGSTLSTTLWYRLVVDERRVDFYAYIVTAVLTLHAHYLAALTIFGQVLWWLVTWRGGRAKRPALRPLLALVASGVFCIPIVLRYLYFRSSVFQGLDWIRPPTWLSTLDVMKQLTFGWPWVFGLFAPLVVLWIMSAFGMPLRLPGRRGGRIFAGREDILGLLLLCWLSAWFGLLVISWVAHPAMVARYGLPAAAPALLIPLVIACRWDRRGPLIIAVVFVIGAAPHWLIREHAPGFRELAAYLEKHVDPESEAAVLIIDNTVYPGWEDSERLGFQYYPMKGVPVEELRLNPDGLAAEDSILKDPRGLYLIALWADPFLILEAAGRQAVPFQIDRLSYSRLLFAPYRLVRVAPLALDRGTSP